MQRSIPVLARSHNKSVDTALNNDLSLAAQQRGARLDSLSAAEGTPSANALNGTSSPVAHHRSTAYAHRSTASSSGGTVVKHTGRDAAIGAAAGAVLGATTSRNKVKGGLIGAAVGGIIGGVIGNNVDKKKVPQ
jgi:Glycine zipper